MDGISEAVVFFVTTDVGVPIGSAVTFSKRACGSSVGDAEKTLQVSSAEATMACIPTCVFVSAAAGETQKGGERAKKRQASCRMNERKSKRKNKRGMIG